MPNSEKVSGRYMPILLLPYLLLFIETFIATYFKIPDGDSWMHLAQGRYILEQRTIPSTDVFSFTHYGDVWINWEWLHNLFVASVWRVAGYGGLFFFRFIVVALLLTVLFVTLQRLSKNLLASFLLTTFSLILIQPRIEDRPHLFSYLFISLTLYLLFPRRPFTKTSLFSLLALCILWRNIHPSWPLGIIMVGTVIADDILPTFKRGVSGGVKPEARKLVWFVAGAILIYLATPYPQNFENYLSLQEQGGKVLGEWRSFFPFGSGTAWAVLGPTFFLLFAFAVMSSAFMTIRNGASYRILTFAILVNVYYHIRFIPEATLLGTPIIAVAISPFAKKIERGGRTLILIVVVFLLTSLFCQKNFMHLHLQRGYLVDATKNPLFAAEFMESRSITGNIYGSFPGTTDFLSHALFGKIKVPVDIRVPGLYSFEHARRLWTISRDEDLDLYVLSLPVDYIIVGCPEHIAPSRGQEAGIELSLRRRQWSLVYFDHLYAIYRRPGLDDGVFSFLFFSRWNTDMKELDLGIEEGRFDDILQELTELKKNTAGRDDFYREVMVALYSSSSLNEEQKKALEKLYDGKGIEDADI